MAARCLPLALLLLGASGVWVPVWSDEFSSTTLNDTIWNVVVGSEGHPSTSNQIELYTADNVYIEDGALVLRTRPQNVTWGGDDFNITSGRVDTSFKRNMTYGRMELGLQLQPDATSSGVHSAAWLLGYECWPRGGEIDIQECQSPRGSYAKCDSPATSHSEIAANYHFGTKCGGDTRRSGAPSTSWPRGGAPAIDFSAGFNNVALEWNSTDLTFFVNNTMYAHITATQGWAAPVVIPSWPMYLILSQAYMRDRPCGDASVFPVLQRIDYVRVFSLAPGDDESVQASQ